jgi:uncharacterized protein (TIGR02284 family)
VKYILHASIFYFQHGIVWAVVSKAWFLNSHRSLNNFNINYTKLFVMERNTDLIEVLNDLIQINNDRVVGYDKASNELSAADVDLKALFSQYAAESRKYTTELSAEVGRLGGEPTTSTTGSGKIYRAWMDVKAIFTGKDRHAVLENCEFGEDAAQKAYNEALKSDAVMDTEIRQLITNQKSSLKVAHDTIKKYRDMHEIAK